MDYSVQDNIRESLGSSERLIWTGRPPKGILFRSADIFMIPFSLLWGGFAIFWEAMALRIPSEQSGPAGIIFPVFGIPFVLVGLYFIFGRFLVDAKKRESTCYGLTNERVIIATDFFGKKTKSLNLKILTDISLTENRAGFGTITFGSRGFAAPWFAGMNWPGMEQNQCPQFERIENAKSVYDQIRDAQKKCA